MSRLPAQGGVVFGQNQDDAGAVQKSPEDRYFRQTAFICDKQNRDPDIPGQPTDSFGKRVGPGKPFEGRVLRLRPICVRSRASEGPAMPFTNKTMVGFRFAFCSLSMSREDTFIICSAFDLGLTMWISIRFEPHYRNSTSRARLARNILFFCYLIVIKERI